MATKSRYFLAEQLHFLGADGQQREVVITIQSWKAQDGGKSGVYVKTHNGVEQVRRVYNTEQGALWVQRNFNQARQFFADRMLSEDAAADQVARRGGPNPTYCLVGDCGAMIPYAAAMCASGDPVDRVERGRYVMGTSRRPVLTVIPGGKK